MVTDDIIPTAAVNLIRIYNITSCCKLRQCPVVAFEFIQLFLQRNERADRFLSQREQSTRHHNEGFLLAIV